MISPPPTPDDIEVEDADTPLAVADSALEHVMTDLDTLDPPGTDGRSPWSTP